MSNKSVTEGPKPSMYRKTQATKPVKPLFERVIDWAKIPLRAAFLAGRRGI